MAISMADAVAQFKKTKCFADLKKIADDYNQSGGSAAKHSKVVQMKDKSLEI